MNASLYNILMIVSFALSGVFLIVAVTLFFKLKIKSVADELSGRKSRKQVAEIRKENTGSNSRGYVPGIFKDRNDKTTSSLSASAETGKIKKRATSKLSKTEITGKPNVPADSFEGTVVLNESMNDSGYEEGTSVLGATSDSDGTTLLSASSDYDGTTLLSGEDEGTTLLNEETKTDNTRKKCIVVREIIQMESEDYLKVE